MKTIPLTLALAAAVGTAGLALAAGNPFAAESMSGGYMVADAKAMEGKCGGSKTEEAKCGANKTSTPAKAMDGKCGEGKCGAEKAGKAMEAKCGAGKAAEAKCGARK